MHLRWPIRSTWGSPSASWTPLVTSAVHAQPAKAPWREISTPVEQALDTAAFQCVDAALATQPTNV